MPFFYNGRLWTTPATMSAIDDSAMANTNLSVGNVLAVIGTCTGGEPNKALTFGDPSVAAKTLRGGELMEAVRRAFSPSAETGGPATVVAIRVNPAVQSALTLQDASSNNVISLLSTDYGAYTNQIKVKVESASTQGLKLTTQVGNSYFSDDNVHRNAFSLQYSGAAATGTISVTDSQVTLQAPAGTNVAQIALADYPTVQQLVDYINTVAGWTATVLDNNGDTATENALDGALGQDAMTSLYTVTANLQAAVDWFNGIGEGYVTATRVAGAVNPPAPINFTYLSGGSDGVVANQNWSDALTTLQSEDVQWVAAMSGNGAIRAMVDAHCQYMSTVGRMERRSVLGEPLGTDDATAITDAKSLNSDRSSLVHLGYYDYNINGKLTLFPGYMTACLVAAAFSGLNPGESMTNKSLSVSGFERKLRNPTDTDPLIIGGVMPVESTKTGYKVVKAVSTWLNNKNYDKVEVSTGVALDFTARNVRDAVDPLRGQTGSPTLLTDAVSRAETTLKRLAVPVPQGPGVLVGDAKSPAYRNVTASLDGDVLAVQFECSPGIPANFIPVTIYAVPYSGTATA